jgi:uncharacterized membrane protein
VSFQQLPGTRSKVLLQLSYDPEGLVEQLGDALGMVSSSVRRDLRRFKTFIESAGTKPAAGV